MDTDALIRQRVWYVFSREKIHFAYPTRTVHIAEKKEEETLVEYVNTVSEKLQEVPLFVRARGRRDRTSGEGFYDSRLCSRRSDRSSRTRRQFDVRHCPRLGEGPEFRRTNYQKTINTLKSTISLAR
jgi:hypothetical protein